MKRILKLLVFTLGLVGCGVNFTAIGPNDLGDGNNGLIIRGMATFNFQCSSVSSQCYQVDGMAKKFASNATFTPTFTVAANTNMTATGTFALGTETAALTTPLGSITLTSLTDNNVKQCGAAHNVQCTQALIEIYTTGTVAGLVNTTDNYGLPITGQWNVSAVQNIGLAIANAGVMQTFTIPATTHRVSLSNFPTPTYNIVANSANAEAGTYSMSITIVYGLQ